MNQNKTDISEVKYVEAVTIGGINPNAPVLDEKRDEQIAFFNRCLSDYPKGIIIGKDVTIGRYVLGEHELLMQKSTYHIGFTRKPSWMDKDKNENK